jgi:hypothetical protein
LKLFSRIDDDKKNDLFLVSAETNNQAFEVILDRGTRYIVVDCGGGTVDITVHELDNKLGTLKELYKATGGPYGSVGMFYLLCFC